MSQDLPIPRQDDRSDGTAVVEWGDAEPSPPGRVGHWISALGRDRRLPLVLAALGAAAALASLVGEWLVMTLPESGPDGNNLRVPEGVATIGGFGSGYLVGLLALVCTVALALRGTEAVRPNARTVGLALAVALLGLLAAAAVTLGDTDQRAIYYGNREGFDIEYGRGLVSAFVACALFAAALKLAPSATASPVEGTDGGDAVRSGRRRRSRRNEAEDDLPPPTDLTVGPAIPFARPEPPI